MGLSNVHNLLGKGFHDQTTGALTFYSIVAVGSVTRQPKKWPEDLGAR